MLKKQQEPIISNGLLETSTIQVLVLSDVSISSSSKIVQYLSFLNNDGVSNTHMQNLLYFFNVPVVEQNRSLPEKGAQCVCDCEMWRTEDERGGANNILYGLFPP